MVVEREFVADQRVPQADLEFLPLFEPGVEGRRIIMKASAAVFLRFVHRDIGGLDHAFRSVAGVGVDRDADGRRRIDFAVADLILLGQHE